MEACINCGKPLGSRPLVCFECDSADGDVTGEEAIDEDVLERVERYFIVAAIRCADCGDIHGRLTHDGRTYRAADFGIDSLAEWELEMDKEAAWIRENQNSVVAVLPELVDDWPHSVVSLRATLIDRRRHLLEGADEP